MWASMWFHSSSDRSVGYLFLMRARVAKYPPRTTFHTVSEGEFSEVHFHEPVLVLTHRAGYPTQEHGRVLLRLEKYPRPPDALGSAARDATQRSARPRRSA